MANIVQYLASLFRADKKRRELRYKTDDKKPQVYKTNTTNEDVYKIMNISRLPIQQQRQYYTQVDKKLGDKVVKDTQKAFEDNPFQAGFMEALAPVSALNTVKEAVGKDIDVSKAKEKPAYKVGQVLGAVGQFATTGGIAQQAVTQGLAKGTTSVAKQFLAQRGADVLTGTPFNIAEAIKQGGTTEDKLKNIGVNTAIDLVAGTAIGVPSLVKLLKNKEVKTAVKEGTEALVKSGDLPAESADIIDNAVKTIQERSRQRQLKTGTTPVQEFRGEIPTAPKRDVYLRKDDRPDAKPPTFKDEKVLFDDYETGEAGTLGIKIVNVGDKHYLVQWDWNGVNGAPIQLSKSRAELIAKDLKSGIGESYLTALDEYANKYNSEISKLKTERISYDKSTIKARQDYAKRSGQTLTSEDLTFERPIFTKQFYENVALGDTPNIPTAQIDEVVPAVEVPVTPKVEVPPVPKTKKPAKAKELKTTEETPQLLKSSEGVFAPQTKADINAKIESGYAWKSEPQKVKLKRATDKVFADPDGTLALWKQSDRLDADSIAEGTALFEYFQNVARDYEKAGEIASQVALMESRAGSTVAASKLFINATPIGKVNLLNRSIDKLARSMENRLNGKKIEISQDIYEKVANSRNAEELDNAMYEAGIEAWSQIPVSLYEKVKMFRNISMLFNPRTMIRNFVSNIVFAPVRSVKNVLATGIERGLQVPGVVTERSQSILNRLNTEDKLRMQAGEEAFEKDLPYFIRSDKFSEQGRPHELPVLTSKFGKALEKGTFVPLTKGDLVILKPAYVSQFARYLKANGIDATTATAEQLERARAFAKNESERATFRDASWLSENLISIKNFKDEDSIFRKAAAIALEGIIPFVKTPVNVTRRMIDYSPVGILRGLSRIATAHNKGNAEGVLKGIDDLASGLTGTGIMALGAWLYSQGWFNGRLPYDSEGNFQRAQGEQGYAIEWGQPGDRKSYTVDWATPTILPMIIGAEVMKNFEKDGEGLDGAIKSIAEIATPVAELSMMSGVTDVLQSIRNQDSAGGVLTDATIALGTSYLGQFVPTVAGQVARTVDDTRRSTTSTKEGSSARAIDKFYKRQIAKIPIASQKLEPMVDVWGREIQTGLGERLLENFLSPGFYSEENQTPVDKEIENVFSLTSNEELLPKTKSTYTVTFKENDVRMEPKDMTAYNKEKGQQSFTQLQTLFNSKEYRDANITERQDLIKKVYKDAGELATISTLLGMGKEPWEVYTDRFGGTKADYADVKDAGITPKEYYELFKDVNLDDKSSINRYEAYMKLQSSNLTQDQKAVMWNKYNKTWKDNPYLGGSIPTKPEESGTSTSSKAKASLVAKAYRDGLATKQVNALKTLDISSPKLSTAEMKAIIKMLSS